jgi:hypothetical protein
MGTVKGANGITNFPSIFISGRKVVLGKPFLGKELLCRYRWRRDDTLICETSGKE